MGLRDAVWELWNKFPIFRSAVKRTSLVFDGSVVGFRSWVAFPWNREALVVLEFANSRFLEPAGGSGSEPTVRAFKFYIRHMRPRPPNKDFVLINDWTGVDQV